MLKDAARTARNWLRSRRRAQQNRRRLAALQQQRALRVHLGCGDDRLDGFVNIDARATDAVDVAMDLTLPQLADGSVSFAFSNAFFEHLYRDARGPHLRRIRQALAPDGVCCYIGVPYFPHGPAVDLVFDGGTLEHVFNFTTALTTASRGPAAGPVRLGTMLNNWCGHGFYQFSPELFYRALSPENGFSVIEMYFADVEGRHFCRVVDPAAVR